jgi:hypothetical protein
VGGSINPSNEVLTWISTPRRRATKNIIRSFLCCYNKNVDIVHTTLFWNNDQVHSKSKNIRRKPKHLRQWLKQIT